MKKRWVGCSVEAEYFDDRKKEKLERKLASKTDRSKFKKTDQDKLKKAKKEDTPEHLLRGRVISIQSQGVIVSYEGENLLCTLKGLLKKERSQFKNLVIVGDWVLFERSDVHTGQIVSVEARSSVLSRADNLSRRKEQLIAANIDQVIITVSVVSPPLKPSIVDRYILATLKGNMTPIIVVNKIDLLDDDKFDEAIRKQEAALLAEFIEAYSLSVPVIPISAATGEGINLLQEIMEGRSSVFSGQSGVGKSSLISQMTGVDLKVAPIVEKTQKGSHTTSTASLLPLPCGGWCIDTPGIKSFGVWDLKKEDLISYFTEVFSNAPRCKFDDCTHTHEKDCGVLESLNKLEISPLRYRSYLFLLDSLLKEHQRR